MANKKRKIYVEPYTRKRFGKVELVRGYEKKVKAISPQHIKSLENQASSLKKDNIGFLEYEILKQIKLYEHYGRQITFDNIEEIFEDDISVLRDAIANLRSKGILKGYKLTKDGNRVFWEFAEDWDDGEDIMDLEDYPKKQLLVQEDDFDFDSLMKKRSEIYRKLKWVDNKIAYRESQIRNKMDKNPLKTEEYEDEIIDLTMQQEELGEELGEIEQEIEDNIGEKIYDDDEDSIEW